MKKLKKLPRIVSFFKRYEQYFVLTITSTIFASIIMRMSVSAYKLKLPAAAWELFIENVGVLSVFVSVIIFLLQSSGQRKQQEKIAEVAERTKIVAKQEEQDRKIIQQEQTDVRLEQTLNHLSVVVDDLRSQLGRLSAQVYQFEGEVELRRKINELEKLIKGK